MTQLLTRIVTVLKSYDGARLDSGQMLNEVVVRELNCHASLVVVKQEERVTNAVNFNSGTIVVIVG